MLAGVHARNDLRLVGLLLDEILLEGVRQPRQLLIGGVVRVVEDGPAVGVEEIAAGVPFRPI
jgi:hypothetical protein